MRATGPVVDLVTFGAFTTGGISRYGRELRRCLQGRIDIVPTGFRAAGGARRSSATRALPLGVADRRAGSLVHFAQLMGDALMLYRPARPALGTVHDLGRMVCPEDDEMGSLADRWLFQLQVLGLRRMDHWVVNSEFTRRCLISRLSIPDDRITYIQLGVDLETFRPTSRSGLARPDRLGCPPRQRDVFELLYVGNEQPRKGLGYLLEAMAMLRARGLKVRLLKAGPAGGGRFRERFQKLVRDFGLLDDVYVVGTVTDDDLRSLYCSVDLYVCPSLLEGGFNWPVMEALACGLPAVATTASLVLPSARDAVVEVPPRSAVALADAVASCIGDPSRLRQMAAAARLGVIRYTWSQTAEQFAQLYRCIADDWRDRVRGPDASVQRGARA